MGGTLTTPSAWSGTLPTTSWSRTPGEQAGETGASSGSLEGTTTVSSSSGPATLDCRAREEATPGLMPLLTTLLLTETILTPAPTPTLTARTSTPTAPSGRTTARATVGWTT